LHRRSGRVPALPYPPSKQIDCTAVAASSKAKSIPFWKTKAVNPGGPEPFHKVFYGESFRGVVLSVPGRKTTLGEWRR
jgi:hypothetical protein